MKKKTIAYFRYTASAISAIKALDSAFLKANKRKSEVELFYGEHYSADRHYPHRYIVAYYQDANDEKDIAWFENYLATNDVNQVTAEILN